MAGITKVAAGYNIPFYEAPPHFSTRNFFRNVFPPLSTMAPHTPDASSQGITSLGVRDAGLKLHRDRKHASTLKERPLARTISATNLIAKFDAAEVPTPTAEDAMPIDKGSAKVEDGSPDLVCDEQLNLVLGLCPCPDPDMENATEDATENATEDATEDAMEDATEDTDYHGDMFFCMGCEKTYDGFAQCCFEMRLVKV